MFGSCQRIRVIRRGSDFMDDLHYNFTCTSSPVRAVGTVCGKLFYFRSRHEHWSFSVSEDPDVDPVDVDSPEEGAAHGFFVEETYGEKPSAASYMPLEDAQRIIEKCAQIYAHTKTTGEL
jgi:hypothetical protein